MFNSIICVTLSILLDEINNSNKMVISSLEKQFYTFKSKNKLHFCLCHFHEVYRIQTYHFQSFYNHHQSTIAEYLEIRNECILMP